MFFITCFEKIEKNNTGYIETGYARTFGYYFNKKDAIESLHKNNANIREYVFNYAVVEEIPEGLYPMLTYRQFFKYDKDKDGFFEIETPDDFDNSIFALG